MVYDYILSSNDEHLLNLDIARCLYAGVMTDTGSFRFSCTTPGVHRMVAHLMEKGLETAAIHTAVFDNYQENRLRFLGFVLSERLHLIPEAHTAIISVSRNDLNRFNVNTGDSEGIVNYPLSMKQVLFSIFISEREDEIRMSFRSKGRFNVNEFARKYFQGGGHHNAAGGKSERSLQQTFELLIQYIQENQTLLQSCYAESL
jgi:phosphoesterase RecJ-like protein